MIRVIDGAAAGELARSGPDWLSSFLNSSEAFQLRLAGFECFFDEDFEDSCFAQPVGNLVHTGRFPTELSAGSHSKPEI